MGENIALCLAFALLISASASFAEDRIHETKDNRFSVALSASHAFADKDNRGMEGIIPELGFQYRLAPGFNAVLRASIIRWEVNFNSTLFAAGVHYRFTPHHVSPVLFVNGGYAFGDVDDYIVEHISSVFWESGAGVNCYISNRYRAEFVFFMQSFDHTASKYDRSYPQPCGCDLVRAYQEPGDRFYGLRLSFHFASGKWSE